MAQAEPGVLLLDDRRVFVAINEAAASLLATTPEDALGRQADEFMPLIARPLYPLAWQGFLAIGKASGEYAAQLADGSLAHLAYIGFANRPVRGLHFFIIEPLPGDIDARALMPQMQQDHIQVGLGLSDEVRERLIDEARRQEWKLPIQKGGQRSVLAALFDAPEGALDALEAVRALGEASIATAAGATPGSSTTVLAGRFPPAALGDVVESIRRRGGRIMTHVDERWT